MGGRNNKNQRKRTVDKKVDQCYKAVKLPEIVIGKNLCHVVNTDGQLVLVIQYWLSDCLVRTQEVERREKK